jgi:transposase-like protein
MEVTLNKRKYFTQEKKRLIVKEHISMGIPITVLARKYGVHAITLYNWKRQMKQKKKESPIDPEFIQKLIEENDKLKAENQNLKAKVGDLSIKNDILKDGLEIVQKKAILKALQPPKKSKRLIGMK